MFLDAFKVLFSASRGRFMSGVSILVSQDKGVASVESVEPLLSALGLSGPALASGQCGVPSEC